MKETIGKWDVLHKEMVDAGKALIPQGTAGKTGIEKIAQVEEKFIVEYNKYIAIYDTVLRMTTDQKLYWNRQGEIDIIEGKIKQLEKEFRDIATVWY